MTTNRIVSLALVAALALAGGGCVRSARGIRPSADVAARTTWPNLVVRNLAPLDLDIFVFQDGDKGTRIGTVGKATTVRFIIDPAILRGVPLQVVAAQLSGEQVYRSEPFMVTLGHTLSVTLRAEVDRWLVSAATE